MERLEVDSKSNSDEEFFDCLGKNCKYLYISKYELNYKKILN